MLSDGTIRRLVEDGPDRRSTRGTRRWSSRRRSTCAWATRSGSSTTTASTAIDLRDAARQPHRGGRRSPEDEPFVIHPGEFCLGRTLEWVELPDDIVARIEGKSSLGRLGLIVHATAGFIDPGWKGTLTLELNNLTRVPIKLYPGLLIAQLSFMALDRAAERPVRLARAGQPLPGPGRGHRVPLRRCSFPPHALPRCMHASPPRPLEDEPSKTPFYIARLPAAHLGLRASRPSASRATRVPAERGAARGVMAISALLVVAAMATAVISVLTRVLASRAAVRARHPCAMPDDSGL